MTPEQEEQGREDLEAEAIVLTLAALLIVDRAAVRGYMTTEEREQVEDKLRRARDIGWAFVRDNSVDEGLGNEVFNSRDSVIYAVAAAGWMYQYSQELARDAAIDLQGAEAEAAARNVLNSRRPNRAETYAIDSVHPAVEAGKAAIVKRLIVDKAVTKTWRTVGDSKVRPTHKAADGQKVLLGGFFTVGGYSMSYPRDYSAPAKETARCRCMAVYSVNWSK